MRELEIYGMFVICVLFMAATYKGPEVQQAVNRTVVEAMEIDSQDVPVITAAGVSLVKLVSPEEEKDTQPLAVNLDKEDIAVLLQITAEEAKEEDITGQALVMCTVLNRVKSEEFPNSVDEVVYEKVNGIYQFSPVKEPGYGTAEVTQDTYKALEWVLNGWDESQGATYFCTPKNAGYWHEDNLKGLFTYGKHRFYKEYGYE